MNILQYIRSALQLPPGVVSLGNSQLAKALPLVTLVAAIGAGITDGALYLQNPEERAAAAFQFAAHLVAIGSSLYFLRNQVQNANVLALAYYAYFATSIGVGLWFFQRPESLTFLGILSVASFYLILDRQFLIASQLIGSLVLIVNWQQLVSYPGLLESYLLCLAAWIAGVAIHVGRISVLKDLVNARAALRSETHNRRVAENQVAIERRRNNLAVLTSGLAHDFNNLLGGILGGLELARLEPKASERDEALEVAKQSAENARRLCRSLLEYSRGPQLELSTFDSRVLIQECIEHVKLAYGHRINLTSNFQGETLPVTADRSLMRSAIINLIANAHEAAEENVSIEAKLEQRNDRLWAVVRVSDDGPGIKPGNEESIFEPFFSTRPDGNGLGLSMVAATLKAHDGMISVETDTKSGASFLLSFPADPAKRTEDELVSTESAAAVDEEVLKRPAVSDSLIEKDYVTPYASIGSILEDVFDSLPFLVFYKDTNNRNLRVNRVVSELRGLSKHEMEQTPAAQWHPDEAAEYYRDDLDVIATGRPKLGITELVEVAPGIKYRVNTEKYPTFAPDGTVDGILVICRMLDDQAVSAPPKQAQPPKEDTPNMPFVTV